MDKYAFIAISIVSLVTILLRFLPFIIFNKNSKVPKIIIYLGKVLPYSIMAMLVVYCMKEISFISFPHGLPEIISGIIVIVLHWWKKNTLFSIISGTIVYMLLIQFVFL